MQVDLAFSPEREVEELRAYLGDDFRPENLENYQDVLDAEVEAVADEGRLYRTSQAYLYNLTVFAMSRTKLPYLQMLTGLVAPGARVLDYGCGIGSDGLLLLEAGYDVEFADFANPSTEYLRWRLDRRGFDAPVHDLDAGVPGDFDASFAFDVLEHVPDAFPLVSAMEARAALVMFNLLEYEPHEQELHYPLPIARILRHAARQHVKDYRIFYGSSHLVAYATGAATPLRQLLSAGRLAKGRARRVIGRTRISR